MKAKSYEFYKAFYDKNRISILQYQSLRKNFQKLVTAVLGKDYYNYAMDVYECDKQCCKDIANRSKSFFAPHFFGLGNIMLITSLIISIILWIIYAILK